MHWYIWQFASLEPSAPFAPLEPFAPLNPFDPFALLPSMSPYLYHGHRSLNSGALDLVVQQFEISLKSYNTYYKSLSSLMGPISWSTNTAYSPVPSFLPLYRAGTSQNC